jgi:hypothetical protein
MHGDHIDRIDLYRLADDGCPHDTAWEPGVPDSPDGPTVTGKDDRGGW